MRALTFSKWLVLTLAVAVPATARADVVLWYNGDLQTGGGGTVNEETTNGGSFNTESSLAKGTIRRSAS